MEKVKRCSTCCGTLIHYTYLNSKGQRVVVPCPDCRGRVVISSKAPNHLLNTSVPEVGTNDKES